MTALTLEKLATIRAAQTECARLRCEPGPTPEWGAYCGALWQLRAELDETIVGELLSALDDPCRGDAFLEAIGEAIDGEGGLGWNSDEDCENGDYPARIREVAAELRSLRAVVARSRGIPDEVRADGSIGGTLGSSPGFATASKRQP